MCGVASILIATVAGRSVENGEIAVRMFSFRAHVQNDGHLPEALLFVSSLRCAAAFWSRSRGGEHGVGEISQRRNRRG